MRGEFLFSEKQIPEEFLFYDFTLRNPELSKNSVPREYRILYYGILYLRNFVLQNFVLRNFVLTEFCITEFCIPEFSITELSSFKNPNPDWIRVTQKDRIRPDPDPDPTYICFRCLAKKIIF